MRAFFRSKAFFLPLSLFLTLFFAILTYVRPYFIEFLDFKLYDLFYNLRGSLKAPSDIVIATIDEKSLEKLGRWPWSRDKIAKLIDKLSELGAEVIALDIILSEREPHDPLLAESIKKAGNVILPVVFMFDKEDFSQAEIFSNYALSFYKSDLNKFFPIRAKRVLTPLPEFIEHALALSHINIFPDSDGVVRWETLYIEYGGYLIPSLSLKVVSHYLGLPDEKMLILPGQGIYIGKNFLPTDSSGRILIPYYGGFGHFQHISIVDILEGKVAKREVEGKIVLVGATAIGIYDLRVTPLSPALPGVEKHASVIAGLLEGKRLILTPLPTVLLVVGLTGVVSLLFLYFRALFSFFILLGTSFVLTGGAYLLFQKKEIFLLQSAPLLNLFIQFSLLSTLKYALVEREASFIRHVFSSYVTERVVEELIKNPEMARLGGERRDISVLFTDLRGFTSLSEKLSPEQVVELLNEYFKAMVEVVFKWDGTLDKFIGDAIMVFWGAPLSMEDHAKRAVLCAFEMSERLQELNEKLEKEGKPPLRLGAGINTGQALVGNIGAEGKKMDYTVIGDTVNLASRLEGLNKHFGTEILISEFTLERIKNEIEKFPPIIVRGVGTVQVKGKEKPVKVYSIEKSKNSERKIIEIEEGETIVMKEK